MDRRQFLALAGSSIATGSAVEAMAAPVAPHSNTNRRPNFLFFIADDLMFRTIGALNNPEVHTPNFDRLVRAGTAFTHCFHQGSWIPAICVASRHMLNSGLGPFQAEAQIDNYPTWGQTLGAAGYNTFITGKWHLDATVLQRSFKEMGVVAPGFLPSTPEMYDRPHPGNHWSPDNKSLGGQWVDKSLWLNQPSQVVHSIELYADSAIDHLRNRVAKSDDPFFMYVAFNSPHDPRQAPKEFLDLYDPATISIPPNFMPQHPFDLGEYKGRDEKLCSFPRTHDAVRLHRHEYYASISHLDHHIGRVLDALEATGKADKTYVILTADHGLAVGEHGLMGKQNQYDCSLRMPLIMRGPNIAAGRQIDEAVYQHCMFATACELAGVALPKHVVFPSLVPLLHGAERGPYEETFAWLSSLQRSIRTKTHKLIVYPQIRKSQVFDLVKDPWETNDLDLDPAYAEIKADLYTRLRAMQKKLGDTLDLDDPSVMKRSTE